MKKILIVIPVVILQCCILAICYKYYSNDINLTKQQWITGDKLNYLNTEPIMGSDSIQIQMVNYLDLQHSMSASTEFIIVNRKQKDITFKEDSLNPGFKIDCDISISEKTIIINVLPREGKAGFGVFPGKYEYKRIK